VGEKGCQVLAGDKIRYEVGTLYLLGFDIITHFKLFADGVADWQQFLGWHLLLSSHQAGGAHALDCMDSSKHSRSCRNTCTNRNSTMKQKDL
jgi:hypothetical protein